MQPVPRICLALILGFTVSLTGLAVAATRGMERAASGQIELCTGNGPVMVYLDGHGEPAAPPHYCPDFALGLLAAVDAPEIAASPLPLRAAPAERTGGPGLSGRDVIRASARDPPSVV